MSQDHIIVAGCIGIAATLATLFIVSICSLWDEKPKTTDPHEVGIIFFSAFQAFCIFSIHAIINGITY